MVKIDLFIIASYSERVLHLSVTAGTLLDRGQGRGVESRDVITGREAEGGT